jgi:ubiquinone biosynthesis monooxygenase Coq7
MKAGEEEHLATLSGLLARRRVRPTALLPLWEAAGFALGAASALLGREGAMAATVAVETVIGEHYNDQLRTLLREGASGEERELMGVFKRHRDEELAHLDTGLANDAEKAPGYAVLSSVIKAGCGLAIRVAKHV